MQIIIEPQEGAQRRFSETSADFALYGGSAGSGKSFSLLLEPLRHVELTEFGGTIFRRTTKQVKTEGGLWDEAMKLYRPIGATPNITELAFRFPSGASLGFAHLEHEKNIFDWQGGQNAFLGFDELTHFTWMMFWYLLSRLRSTCGIKPYVRATCNPDPDSWVRKFIDWWLDEDGFPIPERSGVLRYFVNQEDETYWADSKQELIDQLGVEEIDIMSFTFISAKLEDNQILMKKDPSYKAKLKALPLVERMKLLEGNWNAKATPGMVFRKDWFPIVDAHPPLVKVVRYWDRAGTEVSPQNKNPDWTVGLKIGKDANNVFYILDVIRFRKRSLTVQQSVRNTAEQDGVRTYPWIEIDPGSAGQAEKDLYVRLLAGFNVKTNKVTKSKVLRAELASAQSEAGNVKLLRGAWNEAFLREVASFPDPKVHDDQVDAFSGGFNALVSAAEATFTNDMAKAPIGQTVAFDSESETSINW